MHRTACRFLRLDICYRLATHDSDNKLAMCYTFFTGYRRTNDLSATGSFLKFITSRQSVFAFMYTSTSSEVSHPTSRCFETTSAFNGCSDTTKSCADKIPTKTNTFICFQLFPTCFCILGIHVLCCICGLDQTTGRGAAIVLRLLMIRLTCLC
ncbi:uncharacterized protein BDV14DRAFT_103742 [Aspergillus stella-maris]|uniref:uncharacterized protein n=1 Tax=Aspergillus stella-maris TaxID=1810926 RepID=UPI003CCD6451